MRCLNRCPATGTRDGHPAAPADRKDPVTSQEELPASEARLIETFVGHLRHERHLSQHTVGAYRRDLTGLATFLTRGGSSLAAAAYPQLRRYLAQQHALGYARATIARRVGAIRTFYRWAVATDAVASDPSALLGSPKVVNRLPTVLRPREAAELAEAPSDGGAADGDLEPLERAVLLRDRAVLELLYGSGLRVGEVAGLTRAQVDLDRGRVLVRGKGDKEREVPMSDHAIDALDVYLSAGRPTMAGEDRTSMFLNRRGKPSPGATSVRWWNNMRGVCSRGGGSLRIPSGIRSPRISSKEGPTSELSRNCWDTRALRPRSATRTCPGHGSSRHTAESPEGLTWRRREDDRRKPPAPKRRGPTTPAHHDPAGGPRPARRCGMRSRRSASDEARERLILQYAPLVKYVASRVATGLPASVEQADLVSYGMFGLIDALRSSTRPGQQVRDVRDPAHQGRHHRRAAVAGLGAAVGPVQGARDRQGLLRARGDTEAGADGGRDRRAPGRARSELHDIVTQISFVSVLALDEPVTAAPTRGAGVALDTLADKNTTRRRAWRAMRPRAAGRGHQLPDRAREGRPHAVLLRGHDARRDRQVLGVTESRVCQIHTKAVGGLRGQLSEIDESVVGVGVTRVTVRDLFRPRKRLSG